MLIEATIGDHPGASFGDGLRPFAAADIAGQPRGGEEEPAPAPHAQRVVVAINIAKDAFASRRDGIEIAEPVERGALVVLPAPAPLLRGIIPRDRPRRWMIQFFAALMFNSGATQYWVPAGARHRARRRRDPVGGHDGICHAAFIPSWQSAIAKGP